MKNSSQVAISFNSSKTLTRFGYYKILVDINPDFTKPYFMIKEMPFTLQNYHQQIPSIMELTHFLPEYVYGGIASY